MTRLLAAGFIAALALAGGTASASVALSPAQIQTCLKAPAKTHPAGWPCPAFVNERGVVAEMQARLTLTPGFKPRMRFSIVSPRQIKFTANKDGAPVAGTVVKTGRSQITVRIVSATDPSVGGTYKYATLSQA